MVTKTDLRKLAPSAKAELVSAIVDNWSDAVAAGITTPARTRQFLANIAVETGGLTSISENMTYTSASRLMAVWPRRFPTAESAKPFLRNAAKLAVMVYGGRMGNANAPSLDGYTYRGGGMMQTTGRAGYRAMGFENNPQDLQSNPTAAFLAAVSEWEKRGLNKLADQGKTLEIRKKINGGTNGLDEVKAYLQKASTLFKDVAAPVDVPEPLPTLILTRQPLPVLDDAETITLVQTALRNFGYTEVGKADGLAGTMTRAAILSFRSENSLPLTTDIDTEFLDALLTAAPREFAQNRANAPRSEVLRAVPEVWAAAISKTVSGLTAFLSAASALLAGVSSQFGNANAYLTPLLERAGEIPAWFWMSLLTAVAYSLYRMNASAEQTGVEAYQTGARR